MKSAKYMSIIESARQLFWKHGFKRVTIDELCEAANVSKMTFYKFFANKVELAKEMFAKESSNGVAMFKQILHGPGTPAEKVQNIVQLKISGTTEISREFLIDFYQDSNNGLREFVKEQSRLAWVEIIEEIRQAQSIGILSKEIKPELFLHVTQTMSSLVTNHELLSLYETPSQLISELMQLMAYGLLPQRTS